MSGEIIELVIGVGGFLFLMTLGFVVGSINEKRHYRSIREREQSLRKLMIFSIRMPPRKFLPCRTEFVCGNAVVGIDNFKKIAAWLSNLIGGQIVSYETVYDRARREAVLRMKEDALKHHANCILNVKFASANIISAGKNDKGSGCVEVIAYGTALIPK